MDGFAASSVAPPAPHGDGGTRKDLEDLILPFFSTFSFSNSPLFGEQGKVAQSFAHKARNCKVLHPFAKPARLGFFSRMPTSAFAVFKYRNAETINCRKCTGLHG